MRIRTARLLVGLLLAVAVACLALAAAAPAATVTVRRDSYGSPKLFYVAAPGERNDVVVASAGDSALRITDPGAVISATGQCESAGPHSALCRARDDYLYSAYVAVGDLDDRVAPSKRSEDMELSADGGPGNDVLGGAADGGVLNGGPGDDQLTTGVDTSGPYVLNGGDGQDRLYGDDGMDDLNGGAGDDQLYGGNEVAEDGDRLDGGGGEDRLYGGGGDDTLTDGDRDGMPGSAAPGSDTLDGGPGRDTLSYRARTRAVSVRAGVSADAGETGERDDVAGIENLVGGAGDDRLVGDRRRNQLDGGVGDDTLIGSDGADMLWGGRGGDRLFAGPGADVLSPGPGRNLQSCGLGDDLLKNASRSRQVRQIVPDACEQLEFPWGSTVSPNRDLDAVWLHPHPTHAQTWWLNIRTACPWVDEDSFVRCRGTIILRETHGRHQLLAEGQFRRGADGADFTVPLALTTVGYRWSTGRLGRRSATGSLSMTAERTSSRPFRWRISAPRRPGVRRSRNLPADQRGRARAVRRRPTGPAAGRREAGRLTARAGGATRDCLRRTIAG